MFLSQLDSVLLPALQRWLKTSVHLSFQRLKFRPRQQLRLHKLEETEGLYSSLMVQHNPDPLISFPALSPLFSPLSSSLRCDSSEALCSYLLPPHCPLITFLLSSSQSFLIRLSKSLHLTVYLCHSSLYVFLPSPNFPLFLLVVVSFLHFTGFILLLLIFSSLVPSLSSFFELNQSQLLSPPLVQSIMFVCCCFCCCLPG